MKTWCKIILVWAIITTIISARYLILPLIEEIIDNIKWSQVKRMSPVEQKDYLIEQIVKIETPVSLLDKKRKVNILCEKLVKVDSTDINNVVSYGYNCINLAINEKNSSRSQVLREQSILVARRLRRIDLYNASNLINAAKLYTYNGLYDSSYYDTADVIYNRINFLIEIDSVTVPILAQRDREKWLEELKETVNDLKFYNRMSHRSQQRKYFVE